MTIDQRLLMRTSSDLGVPSTIFNAENWPKIWRILNYIVGVRWGNCTKLFYVILYLSPQGHKNFGI